MGKNITIFQKSAKMSLQVGHSQMLLCRTALKRGSMKKPLHTSAARRKALENWKRPSIDEMTVPKESHAHVFTKNQKKYNMQLLAGVGLFGFTTLVAVNTVHANGTPAYLKDSAFVTKLPEAVTTEEEAENLTEEAEEDIVKDSEASESARIAAEEAATAEAAAAEAAAAETARIAAEEAAAAEATRIAEEEAAAA